MGDGSAIEWTDATWNPLVGCSRVSKGCEHCYAEGVAHRGMVPHHRGLTVLAPHGKGPRWTGEVRFVPELLGKPLSWRKPRRVFVNSMSDLFHEAVPFEQIAAVFGVMAATPHHTYQILTKRPERAREFFAWIDGPDAPYVVPWRTAATRTGTYRAPTVCVENAWVLGHPHVPDGVLGARWCDDWPLPNVWLGVSVEDQATAEERIPVLLELPAAIRWVSYEPALGPVIFADRWLGRGQCPTHDFASGFCSSPCPDLVRGLGWIVVGGESGPRARPFDLAWARSVIEQGRAAGTRVFVKQLGAHPVDGTQEDAIGPDGRVHWTRPAGHELLVEVARRPGYSIVPHRIRLKDRKGAEWMEWDRDLFVQEWPEVSR